MVIDLLEIDLGVFYGVEIFKVIRSRFLPIWVLKIRAVRDLFLVFW